MTEPESTCCDAPEMGESGFCHQCGEHASFVCSGCGEHIREGQDHSSCIGEMFYCLVCYKPFKDPDKLVTHARESHGARV